MPMLARLLGLVVSVAAGLFLSLPLVTAGLAAESCTGFVAASPPRAIPAAFGQAALQDDQVGITFVGHATFLIESPGGVRIATDYNDFIRPAVTPDVATMNRAHATHHSYAPDPGIRHVLRGWDAPGKAARHDLQVGDVRVRNVPTNIRDEDGGTRLYGNSIFVFETAGLCIAHLGHLHHPLEPEHLKELGRIDVVLVPVDGSWTLNLDDMTRVLAALNPPLALPMHYFGPATLARFLDRTRERFAVTFNETSTIVVSRTTLPTQPKIVVLPGR
jgi:L-ascorbate metabolism protein UlaG (beta-lactamase superfamily)